MTRKQREVYEWIRGFVRREGVAPSYEEIRRGLGLRSLNTVHYHLRRLAREGFIRSPWGNRKRAIELSEKPISLPMLGEVQAGKPVESYEVPEEVDLPAGFFGVGEHFALRVRGDSMADDGILEGDVVVVRKSDTGEASQVVVALVDGAATVKRYRRRGSWIDLIPANPAYKPITVKEDRVRVLGVVVALYRKY